MTARLAARGRDLLERPVLLALLCSVVLVPLTFLGPGTDIDVDNVLRAGDSVLEGDGYHPSRLPGAVPHEVGTTVLDRIGGTVLVNLASLAFGALALACLGVLLAREGIRRPGWVVLVLGANPWWWIAASSLGDYTWALGLLLAGVVVARSGHGLAHRVGAGALFGTAVGCRGSTVLLVAAWLLAERTGMRSARVSWRAVLTTAGVAVLVGAAWFAPSWHATGRSLDFLDSGLPFEGLTVHLGRWAVKNVAVFGPVMLIVLVVGVRALAASVARWTTSSAVRFALLGAVAGQLLYLRLPLKPVHLLPVVAFLALLAAASPRATPRWLGALVASQLLLAVVSVTLASPDVVDLASTGRPSVGPAPGVVVNDVRCRLDDRRLGPRPAPGTAAAAERSTDAFTCQARSWRADP